MAVKSNNTMNAKQIAEKMDVSEEYVRKYKGQFRYHKSYYWGFNASEQPLVDKVKNVFPDAVITDSGNHFHPFVGGAKSGSAKDSFLWVTFTV
jgi:hypothetical protein